MSTKLSSTVFPKQSDKDVFESVRHSLRGFALRIRFHTAWKNWHTVHAIAKPLHEALVTEGDKQAQRDSHLSDLVARLELTHPTPDHFPPVGADRNEWRANLALSLGMSVDDDDVKLDEVLAVYEAKNGAIAPSAPDAYDQDMGGWEALNQAVGGDLWHNPEKLAVMRRVDAETANVPWEEFHQRVVEAMGRVDHAPTVSLA